MKKSLRLEVAVDSSRGNRRLSSLREQAQGARSDVKELGSEFTRTAIEQAKATADVARRERERLELGKASLRDRLAAIRREEQAERRLNLKRQQFATTTAEQVRLVNQADSIRHRAFTARRKAEIAAEQAAKKATEERLAAASRAFAEAGQSSSSAAATAGKWDSLISRVSHLTQIATNAAGTLERLGGAAVELADEGIATQAVFNNLPIGIEGAAAATGGLISNFELAKFAATAVRTQVVENSTEFARFASAAQKLGASVGLDTTQAMESLTAAIGRGSSAMLDNLGIVLKKQQAVDIYAQKLGKASKELTENERAEAFRKVALEKVFEAAESVTLTTDGASAAVKRFSVELENLKTSALGGERHTLSLAQGLAKVDAQNRINIRSLATHRGAMYELEEALENAGVSTDDIRGRTEALHVTLRKVRKAEDARLVTLGKKGQLDVEQVDNLGRLLKEREDLHEWDRRLLQTEHERLSQLREVALAEEEGEEARKTAITERMTDIAFEQAFLEGKGGAQEQIVELTIEELRLKAELADIEGDLEKATKHRLDAELAATRAAGRSVAPRRGRRRRDDSEKKRRDGQAVIDAQTERAGDLWAKFKLEQGHEEALMNPFHPDNLEAQREAHEAHVAATVQIEQAKNEALLAERMRALETAKAEGLDPIQAIELEKQARIEAIETQIDLAQQVHASEAELISLTDQIREESHRAQLARFAAERQAQAERAKQFVGIADTVVSAHGQMATSVASAVLLQGEAFDEVVKRQAGSYALQAAATAAMELLRGAVDAATPYTAAMAPAHFRNAAVAGALAVSMGTVAGVAHGAGSKSAAPGGFGAGAFGGGSGGGIGTSGGSGASPRSSTGSGGGGAGGGTPISPETPQAPQPLPESQPTPGVQVIVHGDFHATGEIDNKTMGGILQKTQGMSHSSVARI